MKFSETVAAWPTKPNGQPDVIGVRIFLMDQVRQLEFDSHELSSKFNGREKEVFELRKFIAEEGIPNLKEQDEQLILAAIDLAIAVGRGRDDLLAKLVKRFDFYRLQRLIPILGECEILDIVMKFVFGFARFADAAVTLQSVEETYKKFRKDIARRN